MLKVDKRLWRRVSIRCKNGALAVDIAPRHDKVASAVMLLAFVVSSAVFCLVFIPPFITVLSLANALSFLLFLCLIVAWFLTGFCWSIWRIFGVEHIAIEDGVFRWTRTALWWSRTVELQARQVTEVKASAFGYGHGNHVELMADGRRRAVGHALLREEASELAHEMRRAVGIQE
jgi:hypothetical protein